MFVIDMTLGQFCFWHGSRTAHVISESMFGEKKLFACVPCYVRTQLGMPAGFVFTFLGVCIMKNAQVIRVVATEHIMLY